MNMKKQNKHKHKITNMNEHKQNKHIDQLVKSVFDREQCSTLFASISQLQSILNYEKLSSLPFKLKKVVIGKTK